MSNKIARILIIISIIILGIYFFITNVSISVPVNDDEVTIEYSKENEEMSIYVEKKNWVITDCRISEKNNSIIVQVKAKYYFSKKEFVFGAKQDGVSTSGKENVILKSIARKKEIYKFE